MPELPVYGVAIPTVSGMRLVLDELGAAQGLGNACSIPTCLTACIRKPFIQEHTWPIVAGQRRVMWFNMREEPVIYINGNPYVVREANKPFANLEYTGSLLCHADTLSIAEVLSRWLSQALFVPNTSARLADNWLAHTLVHYSMHKQTAGHTWS